MTIDLDYYYDRFDAADNYERHLFRAGNVLQSAELNELQSASMERLRAVTDALLKDGDVLRGADIVTDPETGACTCQNGAVYLRGAVRGVPPRTFTVPTSGLVSVGVYLVDTIITELADPTLRDPAVSSRNYQEPGAARLQVTPTWGYAGDGHSGAFYPVYEVENGIVLSKAPPPQVDAVALAIARYDRQSAGGYYVSNGLKVTRLADVDGKQVYSMAAGVARVAGSEIIRDHARRFEYAAVPDTRSVALEPHVASGGTERVNVNFAPIHAVASIAITRQETKNLIHGAFSGSQDLIRSDGKPIVQILSVSQGATTYTAGDDYQLTADKVDWSPAGAEPAPGSTYSITYQYIAIVAPIDQDATGFSVQSAVAGSLIQVSYAWSMPRYDLICLDPNGNIVPVKGVAAPVRPRVPSTPKGLLAVAVLDQRWSSASRVINNAVTMVPMNDLNRVNTRIDTLFALVAEERLALNLTQRDNTAKKGVFADPFFDDDLRDQGLEQDAAIFNATLMLGVAATVHSVALSAPVALDARVIVDTDVLVGPTELALSQTLRTGSMKVNPYDSFAPLPGVAVLSPAVDYWTEFDTKWTSPVTKLMNEDVYANADTAVGLLHAEIAANSSGEAQARFIAAHTVVVSESQSVSSVEAQKVGTKYVDLQYLRTIPVIFELTGFCPGEVLQTVKFDGKSVAFTGVA